MGNIVVITTIIYFLLSAISKMKKHTIFLILAMLFCFNACDKNIDGVYVSIENQTSKDFKEVIVNNESFDNVAAGTKTSYQLFENTMSLPLATLVSVDNDTTYAGLSRLYYDWIGHLENGKYTLRIFEDTSFTGFNCEYIKN